MSHHDGCPSFHRIFVRVCRASEKNRTIVSRYLNFMGGGGGQPKPKPLQVCMENEPGSTNTSFGFNGGHRPTSSSGRANQMQPAGSNDTDCSELTADSPFSVPAKQPSRLPNPSGVVAAASVPLAGTATASGALQTTSLPCPGLFAQRCFCLGHLILVR